jgi:Asp-tRNA(Asn)/Glu-tRNA(Gln) amidotransferase A subunit family amidase
VTILLRAVLVAAVLVPVALRPMALEQAADSQAGSGAFVPEEATIAGLHAALSAGRVSCVQVVRAHLRRIDAYDDRGPSLNAVIAINGRALDTAAEPDRVDSSRSSFRPLHCVPVVLKDNYDTADMPTTGGSVAFSSSVPLRDAFVVRKLRDAGAIVLAKTNLTELARGGTTVSSLGPLGNSCASGGWL